MSDETSMLQTSQLQPNPFQPRGKIVSDDISELKQSIKQYGILEPIVVAQTPAGYQIIAGERRWRAARELELETVPVLIKKTTPKGMLEMALIENVQRVDLTSIERAQAFQQLVRDFGYNLTEVSERIGKSVPYISNTIKLLSLPDAIKDGLLGNLISEGHARALLGLIDEKAMIDCYKIILKENASVRRAEDLVRRFKAKYDQQPDPRGRDRILVTPDMDKMIDSLKKAFHKTSQIKMTRSARQTRVTIVLKGSPEETQSDLEKLLSLSGKK